MGLILTLTVANIPSIGPAIVFYDVSYEFNHALTVGRLEGHSSDKNV